VRLELRRGAGKELRLRGEKKEELLRQRDYTGRHRFRGGVDYY